MEHRSVTVGIGPVSGEDVVAVARRDAKVVIAPDAWAEVAKSREIIEALADDQ
jgi:histidine ammonia-lyase